MGGIRPPHAELYLCPRGVFFSALSIFRLAVMAVRSLFPRGADVTRLPRADVMTPCRADGPIQLAKTYLEACTMPGPISSIKLDEETVNASEPKRKSSAKKSMGKKHHPHKKTTHTVSSLALMVSGKAVSREISTFSVSLQKICRKSQNTLRLLEKKNSKPVKPLRRVQKCKDTSSDNKYCGR